MLIQSALGRMRLHISDGEMRNLGWYSGMDSATREAMRQKGWKMLQSLQRYLVDTSDVDVLNDEVRDMGEDYAQFLIDQGLGLSQAMQGFLVFSNFLHEAALNIIEVVNVRPSVEWLNMLRQVRQFNNEMLIGLTLVYETRSKAADNR